MPEEIIKNRYSYCKDCRFSSVSNGKMYCAKKNLNRTFVYNSCEKFESPEEKYIDKSTSYIPG